MSYKGKMAIQYNQEPYEKLQFYKNICFIRQKVYKITEPFCAHHIKVVGQARDAARSAKQNIREGYKKDSIGTFINHLKISKGSLDELLGDLQDFYEDKLIIREDFVELESLIQRTDYMIDKYIDSIYQLSKDGKWKSRWKKS
jgi:four helix bundle protein